MTTQLVPHPKVAHERITVHVVPLDIDDDRALALLDRYVEAFKASEYPPFSCITAVFADIYAIGMARRAAETLP